MSANKRRFTRVVIEIPATLVLPGETRLTTQKLTNLSMSGCLFPHENEPIAQGAACRLEIYLVEPDQGPSIVVDGTIARSEQGFAAVNFSSIEPQSLYHLKNLIRYNSKDVETIEQEFNSRPGII